MLFTLAKSDPSGARTFYRAVLAPVLDGESCSAIAESLIERRVDHYLSNDAELRVHAALMDQARPQFCYANEAAMREQYHQLLTKLSNEPGAALSRLRTDERKQFSQWLRNQEPSRTFCTEIYEWAWRCIRNKASRHQLKIVADAAQQLVFADSQAQLLYGWSANLPLAD